MKKGLFVLALMAGCAAALSPPAAAQMERTASGNDRNVSIDATAEFLPGTSLMVNLTVGINKSQQKNLAYISVHSPPGETAVMTCGVMNNSAPGSATHDCNGNNTVESHALVSKKDGNNVTLTYDMRSADNPASNISIEVSYI